MSGEEVLKSHLCARSVGKLFGSSPTCGHTIVSTLWRWRGSVFTLAMTVGKSLWQCPTCWLTGAFNTSNSLPQLLHCIACLSHQRAFNLLTLTCLHCSSASLKAKPSFVCKICNKRFLYKQVLRIHKLAVHKKRRISEVDLCCEVCKRPFKNVSHLASHLRVHVREKSVGIEKQV